jgi:hypothetical protein
MDDVLNRLPQNGALPGGQGHCRTGPGVTVARSINSTTVGTGSVHGRPPGAWCGDLDLEAESATFTRTSAESGDAVVDRVRGRTGRTRRRGPSTVSAFQRHRQRAIDQALRIGAPHGPRSFVLSDGRGRRAVSGAAVGPDKPWLLRIHLWRLSSDNFRA